MIFYSYFIHHLLIGPLSYNFSQNCLMAPNIDTPILNSLWVKLYDLIFIIVAKVVSEVETTPKLCGTPIEQRTPCQYQDYLQFGI